MLEVGPVNSGGGWVNQRYLRGVKDEAWVFGVDHALEVVSLAPRRRNRRLGVFWIYCSNHTEAAQMGMPRGWMCTSLEERWGRDVDWESSAQGQWMRVWDG